MKSTKPKETKAWMIFEDELESYLKSSSVANCDKIAEFWIKDFLAWVDKQDAEAKERLKTFNSKDDWKIGNHHTIGD